MACVVVPMVEAVITTIATKVMEKKEKNYEVSALAKSEHIEMEERLPVSKKLKWLNNMLWGGSALLVFEHVWHGEIAPWFPFLTGASDPESLSEMLNEMSTAGVGMSLLVTAAWIGMMAVSSVMGKRGQQEKGPEAQAEGAE